MLRQIAYALVALLVTVSLAVAQECVPPGVVYNQATAPVPHARMVEILSGPDAHWVTQNYNAMEPVSAHFADHVAVVGAEGIPVYLLIGFTSENCTVFSDTVPIPLYQAWRKQGA